MLHISKIYIDGFYGKLKGQNINMNISFNPSVNTNSKQNNIQFKGVRGDKIVGDIIRGAEVKPDSVIKEFKGTLGIKTDKATDILESFIEKIETLFKEKTDYSKRLNEAEEKIRKFPREKDDAVFKAESKLREYFQNIISSKNAELAQKDKELKDAKDFAAKYEPMAKVKSINEIGVIMPERANELINEVVENKVPAYKSMEEFLFEGKGQEEALKQLDRFMEISKAEADGIFNIPSMEKLLDSLKQEHRIYISNTPLWNIRNMVENALSGSEKADLLESKTIKAQVKKNAMAILTPHTDNRYPYRTINDIEKELDDIIESTIKYRRGFAKGLEKLKKKYNNNVTFEFKKVPYDNYSSTVIVKPANEEGMTIPYSNVSSYGNSNCD